MRFKSATFLAAVALLALAASHARAQLTQQQIQEEQREEYERRGAQQQQDEKVIEDFVTTRGVIFDTPKPSAKPKAAGQSQRKNSAGGSSASKGQGSNSVASKKGTSSGGGKKGTAPAGSAGSSSLASNSAAAEETTTADGAQILKASAPGPIALGYTIYMKDAAGALFPVEPSRTYKENDSIALVLETNTDGYLYVFNAENGRNPKMIYPSLQLDNGSNVVRAHVRETYPADASLGFVFDAVPATEHLFIVLSREPLAGVPTGDALAKFCGNNVEDCEWQPTAAQWARIAAGAAERGVVEAKSVQLARADTQPVMPATLQRGIKIKKEEPRPTVVRVSNSPAAKMLVTKIELVHR